MRLRMMVLAVLMAGVLLVPASASAQAPSAAITDPVPITATGPAGTFVGQFNFDRFARRSGQLVALGTVTGTFTPTGSTTGTQITPIPVAIPVVGGTAQESCTILDLTLGPLFLDILGLQVDLSQIDLVITAVPGAGNLLGNLLCQIAGLLDGSGAGGLATLLNRLLGL